MELGQGNLESAVDVAEAAFGRGGRVAIFDARGLPLSGGHVRLVSGQEVRVLHLDPTTGFVDREPELAAVTAPGATPELAASPEAPATSELPAEPQSR